MIILCYKFDFFSQSSYFLTISKISYSCLSVFQTNTRNIYILFLLYITIYFQFYFHFSMKNALIFINLWIFINLFSVDFYMRKKNIWSMFKCKYVPYISAPENFHILMTWFPLTEFKILRYFFFLTYDQKVCHLSGNVQTNYLQRYVFKIIIISKVF